MPTINLNTVLKTRGITSNSEIAPAFMELGRETY